MGYLISITASSRKQAEKTLSELTGVLKKQGKKVSKVRVATNLAPPNTKSPYISSSFDINARYSHLPSIAEKLKNNDIVFIIGSMAETVIREADKFKTKDELTYFIKWLNETETVSYGLPETKADIIISDTQKDSLHKYASVSKKTYLFSSIQKPQKIIGSINKPAKTSKPKHVLYDVILLRAMGKKVKYKVLGPEQTTDKKLKELMHGNELIVKKVGIGSYYTAITTPLSAPVQMDIMKVPKMHKSSVAKVVATTTREQALLERSNQVSFWPRNEIELAGELNRQYGSNTVLNLNQRLRLFETWLAGDYSQNLLLKIFEVRYSGYLSFYDYMYLSEKFELRCFWTEPSVYDGFIDCSAPNSIENLVQDLFDTSTAVAGVEPNSSHKYLLLGHKAYFSFIMSWQDLFNIYLNGLKGGSELTEEFTNNLIDSFMEKFPTITETIKK